MIILFSRRLKFMRNNKQKYMKYFFILILMLCATAWSEDNNAAFNPENVLIDVRSPQEYEAGHIKNAKNIPVDKIAEDIKYFVPDKEKTIVLYCRSGKRSAIAEKTLKDLGYKNVINAGTYDALKALEDKGN
jgi:phage shock protein E